MPTKCRFLSIAAAAMLLTFAHHDQVVQAATINGLFNTGVNGLSQTLLAGGIPDSHYSLIVSPTASTAMTVTDTAYPFPPWIANNYATPGSRWIGPAADGNGLGGNYVYRTTFNLPAVAQLNTVNVSGQWSVDDFGTDIRINGISTGQTKLGFLTLAPFSVSGAGLFVTGLNTLDFYVTNAFPNFLNPTGLRVDKIVGTYQVPEPATLPFAVVALLAAAISAHRFRSVSLLARRSLMTYQRSITSLMVWAAAAVWAASLAAPAMADPLPGRDLLKFSQVPMISTTIPGLAGVPPFNGHDELSTAYGFVNAANGVIQHYDGNFMADDFADLKNDPVLHVKWWGSYIQNNPNLPVNKFLISFESDVPAGPVPSFSHPGSPLLNQVVSLGPITTASGTYSEKVVPGSNSVDGPIYEYNAELKLPFPEKANNIYWLKIAALVDVPATFPTFDPFNPQNSPVNITQWGWHNRDYTVNDTLASTGLATPPGGEFQDGTIGNTPIWHFQDDAVTGQVNIGPDTTGTFFQPTVNQPLQFMRPTHYVDNIDGPGPGIFPGDPGIGFHSKDLAFNLYTSVPEPTSCVMFASGCIGLVMFGRRRRAAC